MAKKSPPNRSQNAQLRAPQQATKAHTFSGTFRNILTDASWQGISGIISLLSLIVSMLSLIVSIVLTFYVYQLTKANQLANVYTITTIRSADIENDVSHYDIDVYNYGPNTGKNITITILYNGKTKGCSLDGIYTIGSFVISDEDGKCMVFIQDIFVSQVYSIRIETLAKGLPNIGVAGENATYDEAKSSWRTSNNAK